MVTTSNDRQIKKETAATRKIATVCHYVLSKEKPTSKNVFGSASSCVCKQVLLFDNHLFTLRRDCVMNFHYINTLVKV